MIADYLVSVKLLFRVIIMFWRRGPWLLLRLSQTDMMTGLLSVGLSQSVYLICIDAIHLIDNEEQRFTCYAVFICVSECPSVVCLCQRFCTEADAKNMLQCLKQNKNSELMDPKCKQMITKRQITQNTGGYWIYTHTIALNMRRDYGFHQTYSKHLCSITLPLWFSPCLPNINPMVHPVVFCVLSRLQVEPSAEEVV